MLELRDFVHLPQLEPRFAEMVAAGPGLVLVAGLDPRPHAADTAVLPSGRATIFRILARQMFEHRGSGAFIGSTKAALRLPRRLQRRVSFHLSSFPDDYPLLIEEAAAAGLPLMVVERLEAGVALPALGAAADGHTVLSQIDSVFRGRAILRTLAEMGVSDPLLAHVDRVISVQRLPILCSECKEVVTVPAADLEVLTRRFPDLGALPPGPFYRAAGCENCGQRGRQGHVAVFDLYCVGDEGASFPLERYVLHLAAAGYLSLEDLRRLEENQLRRTYHLLGASERALQQSNTVLARRVAELESAYQVLQRRTETLVSLQDVSQALIASRDLGDLALRVCHHTCELSGAERAIVYYFQDDRASVLAAHGWDPARLPAVVQVEELALPSIVAPSPFNRWPPGVERRDPNAEGIALSAGLAVPLIAQAERVGVLLLHSARKEGFAPGDNALLQTFANQAALALQRAGLVSNLREKVAALEAAQVGLAQKERLERELELARQVQESMLPTTFPEVEGFRFAARSRPARHVGGDFYDIFALDEHHFGVAIADVSDKGMAAALYMALTRSLLRAESGRALSPAAVLASVNDLLLNLGEGEMFVTLFYGVVDRAQRRLRYARAGHDRPFLFRSGSWSELDGPGTALGILPGRSLGLVDQRIMLSPGDRLFLYSDGLTDVVSPSGALFDRERLAGHFQAHAALPLEQCCTATLDDLADFQGTAEQYDDMTLLALEVTE